MQHEDNGNRIMFMASNEHLLKRCRVRATQIGECVRLAG